MATKVKGIAKSLPRNLLAGIAKSMKEALFPTRCLVCRSFFHPEQYQKYYFGGRSPGTIRTRTSKTNIDESIIATTHVLHFVSNTGATFDMLMDPFLCRSCSTGFLPAGSPMCTKCGIMFKSKEGDDHICGDCLDSPKSFGIARSAGIYEQVLMSSIHCFKYRGKIQLARPLGMLLFATFISFWDSNKVDLIVPVPLHAKKMRVRGFNPSLLLVKDWVCIAEKLNVYFPDITVEKDVLKRIRWTEPQTGLERSKRVVNIKNAFRVSNPSKITGKHILLVDDVYTTGATVSECIKVLLKNGAEHVDVLTLARTL